MRKFYTFLFFALTSLASVQAVQYHFQEGFTLSSPAGWVRNCGSSSSYSVSQSALGGFTGDNSLSFNVVAADGTGNNGEAKQLETPVVNGGVGSVSFWLTRGSNALPLILNIEVYKDGAKIKSRTIDVASYASASVSTLKNRWSPFTLEINEPGDNVKVVFWASPILPLTVNGTMYIDDISLTKYEVPAAPTTVATINTNFDGDATWGTASDTIATVGWRTLQQNLNGYNLQMTDFAKFPKDFSAVTYNNCLWLDRFTYCSAIELPWLENIKDLTLLLGAKNSGMGFTVEELIDGLPSGVPLYTSTVASSTSIKEFVIPINRVTPIKLRISSAVLAANSPLCIYKIATTVAVPVSINNDKAESPIRLEGQNLVVASDMEAKVEIFSANGTKILESTAKQIPLKKGFYVATVTTANGAISQKILVK